MLKRVVGIAGLGIAMVFGGTGVAAAHYMSASKGGAEAWSSDPHSTACVRDLSADGRAVNVNYRRGIEDFNRTHTESRGKNASSCSGTGAQIVQLRSCTVVPIVPDDCSSWTY